MFKWSFVLVAIGMSPMAWADEPLLSPRKPPERAKIRKALADARHFLIRQLDDKTGRSVLEYDLDSSRHGIETALVLRALSLTGERYDQSPTLRRGYVWLIGRPRESPELVALRIAALADVSSIDELLYQCLAADVAWLIKAGSEEGNYSTDSLAGQSQLSYHNPISDLVTDALDVVARQDVLVPREFWERNARAWVRSQLTAGGWKALEGWSGYQANFTMTAAGICGLQTSLKHFDDQTDADLRRRAKESLDLATRWLDEQFALPMRGSARDDCYASHRFPGPSIDSFDSCELQNRWLVNLGRLKTSGALARLGHGDDPWTELSAQLVANQNDDGSWGGGTWSGGIFRIQLTASGVVYLASVTLE